MSKKQEITEQEVIEAAIDFYGDKQMEINRHNENGREYVEAVPVGETSQYGAPRFFLDFFEIKS